MSAAMVITLLIHCNNILVQNRQQSSNGDIPLSLKISTKGPVRLLPPSQMAQHGVLNQEGSHKEPQPVCPGRFFYTVSSSPSRVTAATDLCSHANATAPALHPSEGCKQVYCLNVKGRYEKRSLWLTSSSSLAPTSF